MSDFKPVNRPITPASADPGEEFPFLHTITVVDRVVSVDKPELVQNNIRTETVTLNLDSEWDGLSCIINIGNDDTPVSLIWSGQPVVIPAELMTDIGTLNVSVVGYGENGTVRAVTKKADAMFVVAASGYVEDDNPVPDPTTILGQLTEAADRANHAAQNAEDSTIDKVNVTMLPTGSGASGSVADKTLSLRIPNGPQGPQGPQGPKGDPGDLTTVAHDESLYGDGTAANMLKISANMVPSKSTDIIDKSINDLTPGFYMYRRSSDKPGNEYGSVIVLPAPFNKNKQIAVDSSDGGVSRMFVRGMGSNLEYGDWWEVAHQSDVVGTFRNPIKVEQSDLNGDVFDANEYKTPGVYSISLRKSQVSEQSIPESNNQYIRASLVVVKCGVSANDLAQIWINRAGDSGIPFIAMRIYTTGWKPWQRLAFVSVTQESFSSVELETRMQALEAEVESLKNKQ